MSAGALRKESETVTVRVAFLIVPRWHALGFLYVERYLAPMHWPTKEHNEPQRIVSL